MPATQEAVNEAMAQMGCEQKAQRARAGGGQFCATHHEYWWFSAGVSGCKKAVQATEKEEA
jgi:hypothetical protein